MNILSVKELKPAIIMKKMKLKLRRRFSWMNRSLGENFHRPRMKIVEIRTVTRRTRVKQVFR